MPFCLKDGIGAIKTLLETGCIATIGTIGCQMEIVRKILKRGGGYLLVAKDNQPHLVQALRAFLDEGEVFEFGRWVNSRHETVEKEHGRIARQPTVTGGSKTACWILDVIFREDDYRVRKRQAPQSYSTLRQFALALLCSDTPYPGRSLCRRRKTTDHLPQYRASLLGLVVCTAPGSAAP